MQDIDGSIEICMENNATCLTNEGRTLSLTFIAMPADGACSGSVFSSDKLNSNTNLLSFVGQELLQLTESPIGEEPVLLSPMSGFPDAIKFLQNDYSVFSYTIYQSSADDMVHISHKPLLPASHLVKVSTGRMSAFALQPASQTGIFFLDGKNVRTIIQPAIGGGDKVIDAPVYPKHISLFAGYDSRFFYGNHQSEPSIPAFDKIAFFDVPISIFSEIFRDEECELNSTFFSEKTCSSFDQIDSATSFVIMDESSRKFWLPAHFLSECSLDSSTGIFIGDYCKLGRKTETFPENWVVDMVHPECVGFIVFIAGRNREILSLSHQNNIFIKYGSLLRSFFNDCLNSFHHIGYREVGRIPRPSGGDECQAPTSREFKGSSP